MGDRRLVVQIYERLFGGLTASKLDALGDLMDASRDSMAR